MRTEYYIKLTGRDFLVEIEQEIFSRNPLIVLPTVKYQIDHAIISKELFYAEFRKAIEKEFRNPQKTR